MNPRFLPLAAWVIALGWWACAAHGQVVYSSHGWWVRLDSSDAGVPTMNVSVDGAPPGTAKRVEFGYRVAGTDSYPTVAVMYGSAYVRLKPAQVPDVPFGTSHILGVGYWTGGAYFHNPTVTAMSIDTSLVPFGGPMKIQADATQPHFQIRYDIALYPADSVATVMRVSQTATCSIAFTVDADRLASHEGFKQVQASSMYVDGVSHDADKARYLDAAGAEIVSDFSTFAANGFLFATSTPMGRSWLEATHSDNAGWQGATPCALIVVEGLSLAGALTPQGWFEATTDPNDDNLGLWLCDPSKDAVAAGTQENVVYWLLGRDDPISAASLSVPAAATRTSGAAPFEVAFFSVACSGTPPYSYSWDFGDGSSASTSQNAEHRYDQAGTFVARLAVTDAPGAVAVREFSIVSSGPAAGGSSGGGGAGGVGEGAAETGSAGTAQGGGSGRSGVCFATAMHAGRAGAFAAASLLLAASILVARFRRRRDRMDANRPEERPWR